MSIMATIPTTSHSSYKNSARRIYVAAKAFNNDFYTYTVTTDPMTAVTTGALTAVTADANQTPVGRTLREVGRKLYPGANPGITTYMVKVYDDQTGLSGYINPNSATFAIFNTDKPTYMTDGSEVAGGSYSGQNEGNSVYTLGTVTAGRYVAGGAVVLNTGNGGVVQATNNNNTYVNTLLGNSFIATLDYTAGAAGNTYVYFGSDTGTQVFPPAGSHIELTIINSTTKAQSIIFNQTGTYISVYGYAAGTTIATIATGSSRTFTFTSDGTLLYLTTPTYRVYAGDATAPSTAGSALVGTATLVAGVVIVNTTAVTAASKIFVSRNGPAGTPGYLRAASVDIIAGTSFVIYSSSNTDTSTVNWFIVN